MFSKVIDEFFIEEKIFRKDYVAKDHKIEIPYMLKIGDKVNRINYESRGTGYNNARILDINSKGICIYENIRKIVFLNWNDEDGRELEFYPFYQFNQGINAKNFKTVTRSLSDFVTTYEELDSQWRYVTRNKSKLEIKLAKSYIENFKNVQLEEFKESAKQISLLGVI